MNALCALLCSAVISFFAGSPREADEAMSFINDNESVIRNSLGELTRDEQLTAVAVVAPEISQFSSFLDFVELRTLFVMYLNTGASDFSVGYFQMKPSFVETLEKKASASKTLAGRYRDIMPKGSKREKRECRLRNLSSLRGQLRYLQLFIEIVRAGTASIRFNTAEAKLRYWATLYNSGMDLSESDVYKMQSLRLFPKFEKRYNYSSVSCEFYNELKKHGW